MANATRRLTLLTGSLLSVIVLSASGQTEQAQRERKRPADAAELAQISGRGLAIAAYDSAAWHGS